MGYWPVGLAEATKSLVLTAALFAGPIYESLVIDGDWRFLGDGLREVCNSWPSWRNIVAVRYPPHRDMGCPGIYCTPLSAIFCTHTSNSCPPIGPRHRRVPLSLGRRAASCTGRVESQAHHLSVSACLWRCSHSSLLRVSSQSP